MARPFARHKQSTGLFVSGLSLDEPRQLSPGAGLGVGDEAGRMLLHQAIRRSLLRAVAFVVERDAIGRLLGLPADGLHEGLPRGEPVRSQAARYASIALIAAYR